MLFHDVIKTDGKTLISCRDGIQEYAGYEIGLEGDNLLYKVYRSPETIKSFDLVGVPITDGHVDKPPYMSLGSIVKSEVMDAKDDKLQKTIEIKNQVDICKELQIVINDGKNELSLGYEAEITDVRDDKELDYDFTQTGIIPNHLAVVDKGRCGDACKFKDGVKNMDIKTYADAKQALIAILSLLPQLDAEEAENMKSKIAKAGEKEETDMEIEARKKKEADMEAEAAEKKKKEDMESEGKEKETEAQKDEAIKKAIADHVSVIAKATDLGCLDAKYVFANKTAVQIMGDCVKTQNENDVELSDSELPTAFKLLKKITNPHLNFGDGKIGGERTIIKDKEV